MFIVNIFLFFLLTATSNAEIGPHQAAILKLQNEKLEKERAFRSDEKSSHHKMYHKQHNETSVHKHAWAALEEVDGLRNEEVVMLITSTAVKGFSYMRERIIASSRTWLKMFANAFVMIEDMQSSRFALRHCKIRETPHFTSFDCHHEPTYVLSRNCTSEYYGGPGPCCKVDDLFTYLTFERPEIYKKIKYALHCDDDSYWRPDQIFQWLAAIDKTGINSYPIISSENLNEKKDRRQHVWHIKGCEEIHTNGWYQPMMMNRAALERLKYASRSYGLRDTCNNFVITHDVGLGPYAWLFGLHHLQMPGVTISNQQNRDKLNAEQMVVHAMKHARKEDSCRDEELWARDPKSRYNQNMVVGCGDIGHPSPGHDPNGANIVADMYDGWDFYKSSGLNRDVTHVQHGIDWMKTNVTLYANGTIPPGVLLGNSGNMGYIKHILDENDNAMITADGLFQGDKVVIRVIPDLAKLEGYDTTEHSKKYNIQKENGWKEFTMNDCVIKGKVARQ